MPLLCLKTLLPPLREGFSPGSAKVLIFPHMQQNFFRLKQPEFYAILCLNFNTGPPMPGKTGPTMVRDYYK